MSAIPDPTTVLSIDDLKGWGHPGTFLAVLGWPISHSISPWMHQAALAVMARENPMFSDWVYVRVEVRPEELACALDRLGEAGFRGINLTVPHKVEVLPFLVGQDEESRAMGAANTLRLTENGYYGHNSDGYGLARAVEESFGFGLKGLRVLLLGAGGAARAAAVQMARSGVEGLWIHNRTQSKAEALVAQLIDSGCPSSLMKVGMPDLKETDGVDLVINATSLGLRPEDPTPVGLALVPGKPACYDMIYNPARTRFLGEAAGLGLPAANGLSMLVHQGVRSLEIWSGASVPESAMAEGARTGLEKILSETLPSGQ